MKHIAHALRWRCHRYRKSMVDSIRKLYAKCGGTVMVHRRREIDRERLASLRGLHDGERCFLVGTGPSLSDMDLSPLRHEKVFSVNRGYDLSHFGVPRLFSYVAADPAILDDYGDEIDVSSAKHVFLCSSLPLWPIMGSENAIAYDNIMYPKMHDGYFQHDLTRGVYDSHTVMLHAVQIAAWMGFTEIYVLGVDLSFNEDKLHFYASSDREVTDGIRRSMLHARCMAEGFGVAGKALSGRGVRLANVGKGGQLNSIERVRFETLFEPALVPDVL